MANNHQEDTQIAAGAKEILDLALTLNQAQTRDEILIELSKEISDFCHAEGITIYAFDQRSGELYSKVKIKDNLEKIRVPISYDSVVGYAAKTGKVVNLSDPYQAAEFEHYPGMKFDDTWDKKSGFKTRSLLAIPLRYKEIGLQGVVELVNSKKGVKFGKADEQLLSMVGNAVAVALYNQNRIIRKANKFNLLLENHIISRDDLNQAIKKARQQREHPIKGDVASVLVEEYGVGKELVGDSLSQYFKTGFVEFNDTTIIPSELMRGLNEKYLRSSFWVPLYKKDDTVTVLLDDPSDWGKIREIKNSLGAKDYKFCVGLRGDILEFIDVATGKKRPKEDISQIVGVLQREAERSDDEPKEEELVKEDAPVIVKTANRIIQDAFESGASDIHIEPYSGNSPTMVRFRRDGVCSKYTEIPFNHTKTLVNRIKIMSKLKVDEHKIPQSGKIKLKYGHKDVELRVEMTPTVGGNEDVVMRILPSGAPLPLEKLNLSESNLKNIRDIISKPYGIILVVGPTGSGKSTTLHSMLAHLNTPEKKSGRPKTQWRSPNMA